MIAKSTTLKMLCNALAARAPRDVRKKCLNVKMNSSPLVKLRAPDLLARRIAAAAQGSCAARKSENHLHL